MTKISLRFHAERDEVARLVSGWVDESGLRLAYERFTPAYGVDLVTVPPPDGDLDVPLDVRRIVLSAHPLTLGATTSLGFLRDNPNSMTILLGSQSTDQLGESLLQVMTDDPTSLAHWRKLRKSLASELRRGAWVVNTATGARDRRSDHYYSAGAKELHDGGVTMLGTTDLLSYEFD